MVSGGSCNGTEVRFLFSLSDARGTPVPGLVYLMDGVFVGGVSVSLFYYSPNSALVRYVYFLFCELCAV